MVLVLPKVKGFGEQLGESLGGGIQRGADFALQMGMEKFKQNQRKKLIEEIEGFSSQKPTQQQPSQEVNQQFLDALPEIENQLGRELTPQDLDQIWKNFTQIQSPSQKFAQEAQEDPVKELLMKQKKYAAAGEHELARSAASEADILEKRRISERKEEFAKEQKREERHSEISKETLKSASKIAESIPQKESALGGMIDALESKNLGFFTLDNLAELTGIEAFRSPEGAAFKAESKEFLMGNLSRIGAKGLNQWIEKQVNEMSPKIGRSTEANLIVSEILKGEIDLQKKQVEITNRIADEMEKEHGYVRRDLASQVQKETSEYAIDLQNRIKDKVETIKQKYEPVNKNGYLMRDPSGALRRVSKNDFAKAKKAGYKVEK